MARIGVIGSGSWGIALAALLHMNGHQVTVWSAFDSEIESLKTTRRLKTLPELELPEDMEFTTEMECAVADKNQIGRAHV